MDRRCEGQPSAKTWTYHMCRYFKILWPKRDIHPLIRRQLKAIEIAIFIKQRKTINIIGHQNAGKSEQMAMIALAILSLDPQYTNIFAACPFDKLRDSTLWGRIGARFNDLMDNEAVASIFPDAKMTDEKIQLAEFPQSGAIYPRVIDKIASMKGTKPIDEQGKRGWLVILCDEVNEFKNRAFLEVIDNLMGGQRVIILTGCNFRDTEGMEGQLCRPQGREYDSLDPDKDRFWESQYRSVTLRLDGRRCPNVLRKQVIYPYLLKEADRQAIEDTHGVDGAKYLEQVLSFPNAGSTGASIFTRQDVQAHGCYDDDLVWSASRTKIASMDAGFGGDPALIQLWEFGMAQVWTSEGTQISRMIGMPAHPAETIKLRERMPWDAEWQQRFEAAMRGRAYHKNIGTIVSIDQQLAAGAFEFCQRHGVNLRNFVYDGSMRPGFVQEMDAIIGTEPLALDPNKVATERVCSKRGDIASDVYDRYLTELWFTFGEFVRSGQMRGAQHLAPAIAQFVRRSWSYKGPKKYLETKKDYLKRAGASPDAADVATYALEMMRLRGFQLFPDRKPRPTGGMNLDGLKKLGMQVFRRGPKLSA